MSMNITKLYVFACIDVQRKKLKYLHTNVVDKGNKYSHNNSK